MSKERTALLIKIALALLAIFFAAPFTFILIKGLLGVATAVLVAGAIIAIAPAVSLAIANAGIKTLKFESARNPIETLQNEYKEKAQQLECKKEAIEKGVAKYKAFERKVLELKAKYPEEAPQFNEHQQVMLMLLANRKERYKAAAKQLKEFHDVVDKADALWQVTQALNDASADQDKIDEFYSEIRTKTALDSVQESLGRSFAALDISLLEEDVERDLFLGRST